MLWNSFLQKQVHTGSLQNSCSEQGYLKSTPTWMFCWEVAKNIPSSYFFWITNERVLPKIQTSICLEHQQMPLNGWVGNCRVMSNWYNNDAKIFTCPLECFIKAITIKQSRSSKKWQYSLKQNQAGKINLNKQTLQNL